MNQQGQPELSAAALEYLRSQLAARAPAAVRLEARFAERPLDGEGPVELFSFEMQAVACHEMAETDARERPAGANANQPAATGSRGPRTHFVIVGETEPNYFPAFDLRPDEAYSLHIGTRFMLEMRVGRVDTAEEPPGARAAMREFVQTCNPHAPIESEELAGLFALDEQRYAVYRVRLAGQELYVVGADCPPGFYDLAAHPPQVALRLHLGNLIRAEGRAARRADSHSQERC